MWSAISNIFGMLSSGPGKMIAIAALVASLTGFVVWGYNSIYSAGYNEASLEYQVMLSEKLSEEISKAQAQWEIETKKAIALVKRDQVVIEKVKTVYKDVYRTDYTCDDIGENALELLNRVFTEEVE